MKMKKLQERFVPNKVVCLFVYTDNNDFAHHSFEYRIILDIEPD